MQSKIDLVVSSIGFNRRISLCCCLSSPVCMLSVRCQAFLIFFPGFMGLSNVQETWTSMQRGRPCVQMSTGFLFL